MCEVNISKIDQCYKYNVVLKLIDWLGLRLWCLTPLSTIFQLYRDCPFFWWMKTGIPGENH